MDMYIIGMGRLFYFVHFRGDYGEYSGNTVAMYMDVKCVRKCVRMCMCMFLSCVYYVVLCML